MKLNEWMKEFTKEMDRFDVKEITAKIGLEPNMEVTSKSLNSIKFTIEPKDD